MLQLEESNIDGNVPDAVADAISEGNRKSSDIAEALDSDEDKITPLLRLLSQTDFLVQVNDGDSTAYELGDTSQDIALPVEDELTAQNMTVRRDYDFTERIPEDVPVFYQTDGEKDELLADLRANRRIAEEDGLERARLPRYWATGPTGCGKTLLARRVACEEDAALFTIQGRYSMNEADLLGSPLLIDGETVWVDGPLTKALLASQEMPVVLLIDEANRARPESKSVLFSVLDDRCRVELDALGGEIIKGDPMNMISYATINEGPGYQTQKLDLAEMRRFGLLFEMNHLGMGHPETEATLISERSHVDELLAAKLVEVANIMRREAGDDGSPPEELQRGVPTAFLINWARTAYAYEQEDIENPIVRASEGTVVRPFYGNDNTQWVRDLLYDKLNGAPVDGFSEWSERDMDDFIDSEQ